MMEEIDGNELHSRYREDSGEEAVVQWADLECDSHWDYSSEYVRWLEAQLLPKSDVEQGLLDGMNDYVTGKRNWRAKALVYFNGTNDPLYVTGIERYPNGSIKSGHVENGHWTMRIVDGMVQACNYKSKFVVNTWKVDSVIEQDYEEYR